MHIKKEIKYGYYVETSGKNKLAKPSNLTTIILTPINSKFLFYGTKHDILKWMSLHPDMLVEYDPYGEETYEPELTPPSSPLPPEFLSSPTSITPMSTSPTSPSYLSSSSSSPSFPSSPVSPAFPTFPTSSTSSISSSTSATNENTHNIVFDLFTIPIKTSSVLSEEMAFNKPLNIALKHIPWLEVMLEIRPVNENIDSKLHPVHRVILPSGLSLSKISKALGKSWKSLLPDQTAFDPDCFIRNSELIYSQNKSKSESHEHITKSINSDNEGSLSNKFMSEIAKHVPTVDLWLRQKQTSGPIPPGVLTPYIINDVLEDLGEKTKQEESVNENVLRDKKREAETDKELRRPDLPRYDNVFGDRILERGS